jgi:hypothetical protein
MANFTVTFDDQTGEIVKVEPPAGRQLQSEGTALARSASLQGATTITNISLIHKETPSGTVCCVIQQGREWCWC